MTFNYPEGIKCHYDFRLPIHCFCKVGRGDHFCFNFGFDFLGLDLGFNPGFGLET